MVGLEAKSSGRMDSIPIMQQIFLEKSENNHKSQSQTQVVKTGQTIILYLTRLLLVQGFCFRALPAHVIAISGRMDKISKVLFINVHSYNFCDFIE